MRVAGRPRPRRPRAGAAQAARSGLNAECLCAAARADRAGASARSRSRRTLDTRSARGRWLVTWVTEGTKQAALGLLVLVDSQLSLISMRCSNYQKGRRSG